MTDCQFPGFHDKIRDMGLCYRRYYLIRAYIYIANVDANYADANENVDADSDAIF